MKKVILVSIILFISNSSFAQDLIVTYSGDSINCKITKIKEENIYFTFQHKNKIRKALLPVLQINNHQFSFYSSSEPLPKKVLNYDAFPRFRAALTGGYGYHISKISDDVPNELERHFEHLKNGYHIGGNINYYPVEQLGFGINCQLFKAKNSLDSVVIKDMFGNNIVGGISNELTISFVGPSFSARLLMDKKYKAVFTNFSLGYLGYINNESYLDNKYKLTGNTIGMVLDVGYDIGVVGNLAIGFQVSCLLDVLTQFEYRQNRGVTGLEKGEYESLSRVDFSIGIRFVK